MRTIFESTIERNNVAATLKRLIETINERSITTAEEMNLSKALAVVQATPTTDEFRVY